MADLYTVLKLIHYFEDDKECIAIRWKNWDEYIPMEIKTVKEIKEQFDLRETKVVEIKPWFVVDEYKGFILILK